jgi:hypothetical protein
MLPFCRTTASHFRKHKDQRRDAHLSASGMNMDEAVQRGEEVGAPFFLKSS